MGTKIKAFLATLAVTVAALFGVGAIASPASAGTCTGSLCGKFYHYAPDDGFDDAIRVTCDLSNPWNTSRMVAEGQWSPCQDTDAFYVPSGQKIACQYPSIWTPWITFNSSAGWVKFYDGETKRCVAQLA